MAEWAGYETGLEPAELWGWRDLLAQDQPEVIVVVGSVGLALFAASVAESLGGEPLIIAVSAGGRAAHSLIVWVDGDPAEVAEEVLEMAQEQADIREGGIVTMLDSALPDAVSLLYLPKPDPQ